MMFAVPGSVGKDTCDGVTRRDLLRVGGSAMLGLTLADIFRLQATADQPAASRSQGAGAGKAKSVILCYLQGGPSHLDLWDPKENCPERVQSIFRPIATRVNGVRVTELMPRLAQVNDKATLIRTMSYTPVGWFNHTAAIYQMMTGCQADA